MTWPVIARYRAAHRRASSPARRTRPDTSPAGSPEGADYIKIIIDLRGRGAAANAAGRDLDAARCRGHPVGGPSRRRKGMPMPHSGEKELPKHEVLAILRRLGISPATIEAIDREVGDPVQLERDGAILANHGVTRDLLISRMGGSP